METQSCEYCHQVFPVEGSIEVPYERSYMYWQRHGSTAQTPIITIEYGPDPFESEIHGDESPHWLCESCSHQAYLET